MIFFFVHFLLLDYMNVYDYLSVSHANKNTKKMETLTLKSPSVLSDNTHLSIPFLFYRTMTQLCMQEFSQNLDSPQVNLFFRHSINGKTRCLKQTRWDATKWYKQMPLDEMDEVSTSAPLSDRRMERCEPKERTREGHIPEVTHLACLSGLSNSEGQRWEQNKKKKKGPC